MVNIFNPGSDQFYAVFNVFPMPPTVNKQLTQARFHRGFIKTQVARDFDLEVDQFHKRNMNDISKLSLLMQDYLAKGFGFTVQTTFYFPESKILTKKGNLKKLDASNRIKATHDALSKLICIDDQYFIGGSFDKQINKTSPDGKSEYSNVKITLIKLNY
jgi:hypothetical protein